MVNKQLKLLQNTAWVFSIFFQATKNTTPNIGKVYRQCEHKENIIYIILCNWEA